MAELGKTVDTDGAGDYLTLAALRSAEAQDLTDGGGDNFTASCTATAGTADPTAIRWFSWTMSATNRLKILNLDDHGGKWNENAYRMEGAPSGVSGALLELPGSSEHVDVIGIQFNSVVPSTTGTRRAVSASGADYSFSKCIFRSSGENNGPRIGLSFGSAVTATPSIAFNCLVYDCITQAFVASGETSSVIYFNCTAVDSGIGFKTQANDAEAYMCLASDNTNGFDGTFAAGDHNASDTDDGPGTNQHNVDRGVEYAFVDYDADDFHLRRALTGRLIRQAVCTMTT